MMAPEQRPPTQLEYIVRKKSAKCEYTKDIECGTAFKNIGGIWIVVKMRGNTHQQLCQCQHCFGQWMCRQRMWTILLIGIGIEY